MEQGSQYPTLKNPPIEEALLDIQVELGDGFDINVFSSANQTILHEFPIEKSVSAFETTVNVTANEASSRTLDPTIVSYQFISEDGSKIVQMRNDGFSFHQIKSYDRWETMRKIALPLWEHYDSLTPEKTLKRLGMRFLNKFELPLPLAMNDYFNIFPSFPSSLDYPLGPKLIYQFTLVDNEHEHFATITFSSFPSQTNENSLAIILDIDVGKSIGMSQDATWKHLDSMRDFKNKVFFSCINDRLLALLN